jgi:hypothetical protein
MSEENNKDKAPNKEIIQKLKDVENYTIDELTELVGLSAEPNFYTTYDIGDHFDILKSKYPKLARSGGFLEKAEQRIIDDIDMNPNPEPPTNNEPPEMNDWYTNQYLKQDNFLQNARITDRQNKVKVFNDENGGSHETMKREQIGVLNSHPLPIAQDSLNPTLKNVSQRMLVIDSQYRQNINATTSSTDFTLDLSDILTNTLTLKLYSFQIPYAWYTIDSSMGTSCFWIVYDGTTYPISIQDGNYTAQLLVTAIQYQLDKTLNNVIAPFTGNNFDISYNPINGKSCFLFATQVPTLSVEVVFYDSEFYSSCGATCGNTMKLNNNLGWFLGFRPLDDKNLPLHFSILVNSSSNYNIPTNPTPYNLDNAFFSDGPIDVYGTKYLTLVLDDYNQNHLNNGLVNITDTDTTLSLPDYFNTDIPNVCAPDPQLNNSFVPFYTQSTPRTLTQAQIYSINQILENRRTTYKSRITGPTTTDVLAIIPIKKQGLGTGDMMVDLGSSLAFNTRTYFGPVNISRLRVCLQDDMGRILNLHGANWSVAIIVESLYQY